MFKGRPARLLPGWRRVVWPSETGSAGRWCIQGGSTTKISMCATNVNVLDDADTLGAEHNFKGVRIRSWAGQARLAPASKTLHRLQVSNRAARLHIGQDLACPRSTPRSCRPLGLGCRAARALRLCRSSSLLKAAFGARRRSPRAQRTSEGNERRRTSTRSSAKGAVSPSPPGMKKTFLFMPVSEGVTLQRKFACWCESCMHASAPGEGSMDPAYCCVGCSSDEPWIETSVRRTDAASRPAATQHEPRAAPRRAPSSACGIVARESAPPSPQSSEPASKRCRLPLRTRALLE